MKLFVEKHGCSDLQQWWKECVEEDKRPPCNVSPKGFVKIAFTWALYYLKNDFSYEKAIYDVLLQGGDTDTNAAIVGGMIGAAEGAAKIPQEWAEKVINCEN